MKPAAPKDGSLQRPRRFAPRAARTVTAFPVLADRARAWRQTQNGRATTSGQKIISPRCFARARRQQYGARRCLSPKAKQYAPRGCARCKASALCSKTGGFSSRPLRFPLRKTAGLVTPLRFDRHSGNSLHGLPSRLPPCSHGSGRHSVTLICRRVSDSCHRAGATMPGNESRRPDQISIATRR